MKKFAYIHDGNRGYTIGITGDDHKRRQFVVPRECGLRTALRVRNKMLKEHCTNIRSYTFRWIGNMDYILDHISYCVKTKAHILAIGPVKSNRRRHIICMYDSTFGGKDRSRLAVELYLSKILPKVGPVWELYNDLRLERFFDLAYNETIKLKPLIQKEKGLNPVVFEGCMAAYGVTEDLSKQIINEVKFELL